MICMAYMPGFVPGAPAHNAGEFAVMIRKMHACIVHVLLRKKDVFQMRQYLQVGGGGRGSLLCTVKRECTS